MIRDAVQKSGNADAQFPYAGGSRRIALTIASRRGEQHAVADVRGHLPEIGRVRLLDIDHIECDTIFIHVVKPVEGGNLPPEWRSSVAPEYQYDRALAKLGGELHPSTRVQRRQRKIRRRVPYLQ